MGLRQKITKGFELRDTKRVQLAFLAEIIDKNMELELEFYSGIQFEDWKKKLNSEITIGEFLVLLYFFKIDIASETDGIPAEIPILEIDYEDVNHMLNQKTIFHVDFWYNFTLFFDELQFDPYQPRSRVLRHYNELTKTIIGQEEALKKVLFNIHTNLQIMQHNQYGVLPIAKRNILIQGSTGCGKTFLIERLGKQLDIPVSTFDVSQLTQSGYVGMDLDDIAETLMENAGIPQILFLDEFDKLCLVNGNTENVNTYGGQKSLLKLLEAATMQISAYSKNKYSLADAELSNVIIILGGAFSQFEQIKESEKKKGIGFGMVDEKKEKEPEIREKDLIKAGIIPEIAGRIGQVVKLNKLSDVALRHILVDSKEAVQKQFKMLARYNNQKFNLSEEEIINIIKESKDLDLGVRGLFTLCEKIYVEKMMKVSYN